MKKMDFENWEKGVKSKLNSFDESTDDNDFKAFMDKLDQNNFFDTKKNRYFNKWYIFTSVIVLILAYWGISFNFYKKDIDIEKLPKENTLIKIENENQIEILDCSEIDQNENSINIHATDDSVKIQNQNIKKEKISTTSSIELQKNKKYINNDPINPTETINESKLNTIESNNSKTEIPKFGKKIVVLTTDTTFVNDTTRVKHKEKDKR
jgi:hypothetical protein